MAADADFFDLLFVLLFTSAFELAAAAQLGGGIRRLRNGSRLGLVSIGGGLALAALPFFLDPDFRTLLLRPAVLVLLAFVFCAALYAQLTILPDLADELGPAVLTFLGVAAALLLFGVGLVVLGAFGWQIPGFVPFGFALILGALLSGVFGLGFLYRSKKRRPQ